MRKIENKQITPNAILGSGFEAIVEEDYHGVLPDVKPEEVLDASPAEEETD